jgi:arylsulfatase A-like enzyme/Flp pilus assembly protein TadD
MRRDVVLALLAAPAFALVLPGCHRERPEAETRSRPRNLLLLTLDTTRPDRLGCYGSGTGATPQLDSLAARGARFEEAIAPVALTRPSHVTLLTGLEPRQHGVWSNGPYRLEPAFTTIAERLARRGFSTAAVVSSFVLGRSFGLDQGFARYDDAFAETPGADPEKTADAAERSASSWIGGGVVAPPFFLWVHFYDPHDPYAPPEPHAGRFRSDPYTGEVAFMDAAIGRLLRALEAEGLAAETLVVAVADHGEGLGEHGEPTHGYFLYDSTLRVPLILAGPGVSPGLVVSGSVPLADLAPTLLEALGLEPGEGIAGRSFWSELPRGRVSARPALLENPAIHRQFGWAGLAGLRADGWKWIGAPTPELYDLAADPGETRNRAAAEPARAARLAERLASMRAGPAAIGQSRGLSPEQEERLAALGYVASGTDDSDLGAGPDPKSVASVIPDVERLIEARRADRAAGIRSHAEAILARDPTNRFALRARGDLLVAERRFREAAALLTKLVSTGERHPEVFASLAKAHEGLGDAREALAQYTKATTPPMVYWPAFESLARLALRHPGLLPREALVARLVTLGPESYRERLSVARAFLLLGELAPAEAGFRGAIEREPSGAEGLVGLGQTLLLLGRVDEAARSLGRVSPETTESAFVTGQVRLRRGDRAGACAAFARALALGPGNLNLLLGLARHLGDCGDGVNAARAYRMALALEPDHPGSLYQLALLEAARGRSGSARELFQSFLRVAPPTLARERDHATRWLRTSGT